MSEEAPVDASASASVASIKGTIPQKENIFTATYVHIESFFDGANAITKAMASAIIATTRETSTKALVPPSGLVSAEESTLVVGEAIRESVPISTELSTPSKGDVPLMVTQTERASPVNLTPIISTSDLSTTLSQAVKGRSSLVVTPSSILIPTTQVPDVGLSLNEGSNEVLKDSNDEPVIKMRVSDSDDAFDDEPDTEAIGTHF